MSNVSIKIKQLITMNKIYTVGEVPGGLNDQVEKINYHGYYNSYNKGFQYEGPCYVVFFNESTARKIIPTGQVIEIGVEKEEEELLNQKPKAPEEVGLASGSKTNTSTENEG